MTQFVLKEMNDLDGKGKGRVYPQVVINRLMTTEDLVKRMQDNTRLGSAAIHATLLSLGENIASLLDMGFSVKITLAPSHYRSDLPTRRGTKWRTRTTR